MGSETEHPRFIFRNFLSPDVCEELKFIHKSCCTVGYRPNVFSTTLSHLVATNSAQLIMPFLPIRERLKEKVEECFDCQFELVVEFTGLISWTRGASIGWHSDDNRPYLKQRAFAVVCYLTSYEEGFSGGLFHFQDGEPSTIVPMSGDVLMYTADCKNIHSVDEITEGERITLTLWFSRDVSYDEDSKLLWLISQCSLDSCIPAPASKYMYWFPPDESQAFESGFDIRCARLQLLGLDLYTSDDNILNATTNSSCDSLGLLIGPLSLACGTELFEKEFVNIMHALQVVQFYCYRQSLFRTIKVKGVTLNSQSHLKACKENENRPRLVVLENLHQVETFNASLNRGKNLQVAFDSVGISVAYLEWEVYTAELHKKLVLSLPRWKEHGSVFDCPIENFGETV